MAKRRKRDRAEHQEHFARPVRTMMETPAWRALSTTAQALYPWLKLEWRGPNANNNGKIRLSVRQAAERLGVGRDAAARAFHDLQAKGFLVVTEPARLGLEGAAKSPAFELTELALPYGIKQEGRKLYREWRRGHDFPVHKTMANNPHGANGKAKPCHQSRDGNVIEIRSKPRSTSSHS